MSSKNNKWRFLHVWIGVCFIRFDSCAYITYNMPLGLLNAVLIQKNHEYIYKNTVAE